MKIETKRLMSGAILLTTLFTVTAFTVTARAEGGDRELVGKGTVVISAERLFGFTYSKETLSDMGIEQSTTSESFSLLSNPFSSLASGYSFPRVAIDGFVTDAVTLGGSASFFKTSLSLGGGANVDVTGFVLAPRVGFAAALSPIATFWGRVGVTYLYADSSSSTSSRFALTLEAPFVFAVADHFALSVGPTLDLGLAGSNKNTGGGATTSIDAKDTDVGVECGLVGFF